LLRATIARATADRWLKAVADDASVYDRFDKALGIAPDRKHLPRLVRLLNRAVRDVMAVTNAAKEKYARARPFQRFALARVCGMAQPSAPDPSPAKRTSYPSGHSSISWAVALVMMEAAPERAQALITRAVEYGDSRVVCGAHFPSDVEAGRLLAAVVVDKLMAVPEFRRDVMCAKREYGAVLAGEKSENLPACQ
jgi:acid phosphatase (class A)